MESAREAYNFLTWELPWSLQKKKKKIETRDKHSI